MTPALRWLDERLTAQGTTVDEIVRVEHQRAGGDERDRPQRDHQHAPDVGVRLGRNSSRASVWSMKSSGPTPALPLWTSRHAIITGTRSRNSRGAHRTRSSTSPDGRCSQAQRCRARGAGSQRPPWGPPGRSRLLPHLERAIAFEQELGFRVPIKRWLLRAYLTQAAPRYLGTIAHRQRAHPRPVPLECRCSGKRDRGPAPPRAARARPGLGPGASPS